MVFSVSIVMPAFNEAENVGAALFEVESAMNSLNADYEIILVDDGSLDATHAAAEKAASGNRRIRVVGYAKNNGKGFALKYGISFASKPLVFFFDADRDIPAEQLGNFLGIMQKTGADIVVGSKLHPESKVKYPLLRIFMSNVYHSFVKLLFGLGIRDTQTGLKLFRREALVKILPLVSVKRFAFDLELLVIAKARGYRIVEAPVEIDYKNEGSKVNLSAVFGTVSDTLSIFWNKNFRHAYGGHN